MKTIVTHTIRCSECDHQYLALKLKPSGRWVLECLTKGCSNEGKKYFAPELELKAVPTAKKQRRSAETPLRKTN